MSERFFAAKTAPGGGRRKVTSRVHRPRFARPTTDSCFGLFGMQEVRLVRTHYQNPRRRSAR